MNRRRKEMLGRWTEKILFTLISVKIWGLVIGTWLSTWLLLSDKISGGQWVTFNTTIWALIFGMKEIFRITGLTMDKERNEKVENEIKYSNSEQPKTKSVKEIVGENPN